MHGSCTFKGYKTFKTAFMKMKALVRFPLPHPLLCIIANMRTLGTNNSSSCTVQNVTSEWKHECSNRGYYVNCNNLNLDAVPLLLNSCVPFESSACVVDLGRNNRLKNHLFSMAMNLNASHMFILN